VFASLGMSSMDGTLQVNQMDRARDVIVGGGCGPSSVDSHACWGASALLDKCLSSTSTSMFTTREAAAETRGQKCQKGVEARSSPSLKASTAATPFI
jgi:hypothetical protein